MADHDQLSTDEIKAAFGAGYDLERELLGGGMSRVFLATERALGRRVVIKVLPPELAAGVNRERFRREVQLAAQLQHPHIVPLYAAGSEGDLLYYTMPFIEGESLKHALQEHRQFSPRDVVRILHDVVDALGYAHARGVIHRDIKPGNVLMSGRHAVVTDFGVAKAISAAMPSAGMTMSGMVVGSPAYMAPEQLAGDPAADHRVDLYAAGLLAYELLTGHTPFEASSPQETMAAQLTRTPPTLDSVRRDVPPAFAALVNRCLAKRPEDRPQSATELLAALDALDVPSGEFAAPHRTRNTWVAIAAVVGVVAAVTVWRDAHTPEPPPVAPSDTMPVAPAGPPLTRAESLAIAKAVEASVNAQREELRARTPATATGRGTAASGGDAAALRRMADSIRDEVQRAVFDSLARVQQAASNDGGGRGGRTPTRDAGRRDDGPGPTRFIERFGPPSRFSGLAPEFDSLMGVIDQSGRAMRAGSDFEARQFALRAASLGPPRRVVVTEPRISRLVAPAASAISGLADTLRKAIDATSRFIVVNQDSVAGALRRSRTIDDLSSMLDAEVFASITVYPTGRDSARWQVTLRDLTASPAYGLRSWMSDPVPIAAPMPGLDSVITHTLADLSEMDRAPRRPRPPNAPGGPLSKEAYDARAAQLGPPRRLIVWTHPPDPGHRDVEAAGTAIADSIRTALGANARYVVLTTADTRAILAKSRRPDEVSRAAGAELMVTIRGSVARDSVLWEVRAWDAGAFGPFRERSVTAGRVPLTAPFANTGALTRAVADVLQTLDRAPRATPGS